MDPDLVGNQDEAQARRSIYATRKLIVSVGRLISIEEVQAKGKGGKSSGRESSRTERRDESTPQRNGRDEGNEKSRDTTMSKTEPAREKVENNPEREDSEREDPRAKGREGESRH